MTTKVHDHATLLCACGAVVAQCRCLADDKPRRVVVQQCDACTGMAAGGAQRRTTTSTYTFVWDDPPARDHDAPLSAAQRKDALAVLRELRAAIERG